MNSKSKSQKGKPEWVSSFVDQDRYKLSQAEIMQKKISLMSKHKIEAKDQWLNVQEKLKNNIVDDDTQKIYLTALHSKGLNNSTSKRKNLTQMIEWEKSERAHSQSQIKQDIIEQAKALLNKDQDCMSNESNLLEKIKQDLEQTKTFVAKAERLKKPEKITEMNKQIQQNQTQKKKTISSQDVKNVYDCKQKVVAEENYGFTGLKNLDNVISFLENTLHSQEVQISHQEDNPLKNTALMDAKTVCSDVAILSGANTQNNFYQKCETIFKEDQNQETNKENHDWKQNKQKDDLFSKDGFLNNGLPIQGTNLENLNQSEIPKYEVPKYEQFKKEIMKIEEQQPNVNVQQKLNFDKYNKNEISYDDNIDQLRQLLEQTRQELNQMNLQEPSFIEPKQNESVQYFDEAPMPRQFNYQMIYRKYKNSDTFDINDHLM